MLGPIAFTNVYLASSSYALAFTLLAVPAGVGLVCALVARLGELQTAAATG